MKCADACVSRVGSSYQPLFGLKLYIHLEHKKGTHILFGNCLHFVDVDNIVLTFIESVVRALSKVNCELVITWNKDHGQINLP